MAGVSNEYSRNGVTFTIRKLLPMDSKRVFLKHVRPLVRGALSADAPKNANESALWRIFLAAITDAPIDHYEMLMHYLYEHITFTYEGEKVPQVLRGNEELAFKDLDMAHILALEARAFAVNFQESWAVATSEFRKLTTDLPPMNPGT